MSTFLVVYDRRQGKLVRFERFSERSDAYAQLAAEERRHRNDMNTEVVLLGGYSEDDVRRTHSRYFHSVKELAS
jgi:hypothetical protein